MNEDAFDDGDDGVPEERPDTSPAASEKQIKFLKVLQQKVGLSDEGLAALIDEVAGVTLDDLSVRKASAVIDELKIKAREQGIDLDAQPAVSEKQIGFIKSLKRRALLTDAEFADLLEEKGGVRAVEELGRRDASKVIDELKAIEKSGGKKGVAKPKKVVADDDEGYEDPPF